LHQVGDHGADGPPTRSVAEKVSDVRGTEGEGRREQSAEREREDARRKVIARDEPRSARLRLGGRRICSSEA